MTRSIKDFPIYHHYLARILLKVGLAEGSYADTLKKVAEYAVTGRCGCGSETCSTIELSSDSLIGKDGTYCFGFNIGYVIFNFFDDGVLQVESLADRVENNFPFKQELDDVFGGNKVAYGDGYAQGVVEEFVGRLERCDVERIAI